MRGVIGAVVSSVKKSFEMPEKEDSARNQSQRKDSMQMPIDISSPILTSRAIIVENENHTNPIDDVNGRCVDEAERTLVPLLAHVGPPRINQTLTRPAKIITLIEFLGLLQAVKENLAALPERN